MSKPEITGTEVQAEHEVITTSEHKDTISEKLFDVVKEAKAEIAQCDLEIKEAESAKEQIVKKALARKQELQQKLQDVISRLQQEIGEKPAISKPKKNKPDKKENGKASLRSMIMLYLNNNNGVGRNSEIFKWLQDKGRFTNPGTELGRMMKDGAIVKRKRGIYAIAAK